MRLLLKRIDGNGAHHRYRTVISFVAAASLIGCAQTYSIYRVASNSMAPTFHIGDSVLVQNTISVSRRPSRGDLVLITPPVPGALTFIKRIVALPGDRIEIYHGVLKVDGKVVKEPYLRAPTSYSLRVAKFGVYVDGLRLDSRVANLPPKNEWNSPTELPKNCYFVLGDNRGASEDSHIWGCAFNGGLFQSGLARGKQAEPFRWTVMNAQPNKNT